jgi:hypothetical protein
MRRSATRARITAARRLNRRFTARHHPQVCGSLCSKDNGKVKPNTDSEGQKPEKTAEKAHPISRVGLRRRKTHSDFHTTSKLVPSLVRADGTASLAPPLLTMVIENTLLPKVLIGPEIAPAVASFVPLTPE